MSETPVATPVAPAPDGAAEKRPFRRRGEEPTTEELLAGINRGLPFSDEAEKGTLSCILMDPNERLSECRSELPADAFYHAANRIVYQTLLEFYDKSIPLDIATLTHSLKAKSLLEKVGGTAGISDLYNFIPTAAHYPFYKKVVMDKFLLRQMIHACSESIMEAYEHGRESIDEDVDTPLDKAESRIMAVRENSKMGQGIQYMSTLVMDAIDDIEKMLSSSGALRGVSTGYANLDKLCSGLQGGEMFVIAARPSMGKTSLAMNIVEHVAVNDNRPVAVFSLEMSAAMLARRLLVARAGIPMHVLQRGLMNRGQQDDLARATRELQKSAIFIDETPGLDIMELRAKCRRLKKQHDICMVAIDYLQLLTSGSRRAKDNRQIEIAEISAGIKGIAKELNIPIVVLAQLNRGVESRKGQRPVLSDLRESGSIEQDADMVGLLTRIDYAGSKQVDDDDDKKGKGGKKDAAEEADDRRGKGDAVLIIAKNRNGATDDVHLTFQAELMRFIPRDPSAEERELAGG
jgi:replicative DNA helicase